MNVTYLTAFCGIPVVVYVSGSVEVTRYRRSTGVCDVIPLADAYFETRHFSFFVMVYVTSKRM
jgi:hypothetical protein